MGRAGYRDGDVEVGKPGKESVRLHLVRWEKGKPVYAVVEPSDPKGELKNEDVGIDTLSEMTATMIKPDTPVKRSDGQPLHGKNWTLFHLSQSQLGMRFALKMWVDPETGAPHHSESAMRVPLMADMRLQTSYDNDPVLGTRERQSDIEVEKLTPFSGGARLRIVNTPSNWIARPR